MIKMFFRAMYAMWFLLRHIKELPTDEQLRQAGVEPTAPVQFPPPWVWAQGHHRHGC